MNIRFFLALCVLLGAIESKSQDSPGIDSLFSALGNSRGNSRIDILYQLSLNYVERDIDQALCYAREGYAISKAYGDSLYIVRTGLVMASALRRSERHDSAAAIYDRVLPIAERNGYRQELKVGLNSAGVTLTDKGDYDKALVYYLRSLELRKASKDSVAQLIVLNNVGSIYYKLKDYEKALKIFLYCLKLSEALGVKDGTDLVAINAGHAYAYLQKYDSALHYVRFGLKLCDSECAPTRYMEAHFARGVVYFGLRDLRKADSSFKRSYHLAQKENNIRFQLDNIDYLSQIYLETGDYNAANLHLKTGERLLREYPAFKLEASKLFSRLSELYHRRKQFQKAYEYQLKFAEMKDEVYSAGLTRNLMRIEADHLERENLAKISSQQELLLLKEQQIANQRMTNRLVALLGLLSVVLVIILYRNYKQKLKINALLGSRIQERTREFYLNTESLLMRSQERDRLLARRSQIFAAFLYRLKGLCLIGLKETSDPVARSYILKIDSLAQEFEAREEERTSESQR